MYFPRFSAIVFDLDGTLVDSLPGIEYSFRKALNEVLPEREAPPIRHLIGPHIREIFHQALGGVVTSAVLDALEVAYRRSYDSEGCLRSETYPRVIETLVEIKHLGITCHIVTNKPQMPTMAILEHLNLNQFFSAIVCRDSRNPPFHSKTEALAHLTKQLYHPNSHILFVGDSCDDAKAAKNNNFAFAAADYGYGCVSTYFREQIDFHLPDFTSLLQLSISKLPFINN